MTRDYPRCCTPVDLSRYSFTEPPTETGESIGYYSHTTTTCETEDPAQWFETMTCSDYTGGTLGRSNVKVLTELLSEHHPAGESPAVWLETYGGHGTSGLLVRYFALAEECRAALDAFDDYPCIDENAYSDLECEEQNEAWSCSYRSDFERALRKALSLDDLPELAGDGLFTLFHLGCAASNTYWEDSDIGQHVDVDDPAAAVAAMLKGGPVYQYADNHDVDALDAMRAALAPLRFRAASHAWFTREPVQS